MSTKPDHKPTGRVCTLCGRLSSKHRPARRRGEYMTRYNRANPPPPTNQRIVFVDGEGQGRDPHLYNYLAGADEFGQVWEVGSDPRKHLSTQECLDFFLDLPQRTLVFAYAFLYDLTKILKDLPDRKLYLLFHEQKRARLVDGTVVYIPVKWKGYRINYMHRKFSVAKNGRRVGIWDIFAFFQSKFTKACQDWKVGDKLAITEMERMKERRSTFDAQSFEEIKTYCKSECAFGAALGRKLLDAHVDAGYPLKSYRGAGSTATALMTAHVVKDFITVIPDGMKEAVASAFFGGRFENSVIGPIRRPVWNADISSAYPYAATFLPCLLHGEWRCVKSSLQNEIERSRLALIQWSLPRLSGNSSASTSWGPLPVRKLDGTIAFPLAAVQGWTWKEEFLAAQRMRSDVIATSAWVFQSDCDHVPFSFLPAVYLERLRIGKDGPGIVLKLGPNSVYGKLVQSVGFNPPFQCWIWGGNITSTCRGQLLDAIRLCPSSGNVLMLATDGVWSDVPIGLPGPRDTGTFLGMDKDTGTTKPLGGWEIKEYPRGVFAARPGIYFPLDPTEDDITKVRARGLGRKVLYERHASVLEAFESGASSVEVSGGQRFIGCKSGVRHSAKGTVRDAKYGEWIDWTVKVSFDPRPKRAMVGDDNRLVAWGDPDYERTVCRQLKIEPGSYYFDVPSLPYSKAMRNDEEELIKLAQLIAEEQPNADYVEG